MGRRWRSAGPWAAVVGLAAAGLGLIVASTGDRPPHVLDLPAGPTGVPPTVTPPTGALRPSYRALSRSAPVRITIRSVWIDAKIEPLDLARDGTLRTPPYERARNAGWYRRGPSPGERGAAVVVGHVDSTKDRAVFFELRHVKPGATIRIRRADGTAAVFTVDSVEQFPKSRFPTDRVYADTPYPALRLVTCGGRFDRRTHEYSDNIVVFASGAAAAQRQDHP